MSARRFQPLFPLGRRSEGRGGSVRPTLAPARPAGAGPWPWIALASFGFASGTLLSKLALDAGVDPLLLTGARYLVALAGIVPLLALTRRLGAPRDWRRGSILGVVNLALPPIFLTIALATFTASLAGLVVALIPIASILAAHVLVPGERFQAWRLPGLVLSFGGIALLLGGAEGVDTAALPVAVGWAALGVAAAGAGGALSRRFALQAPTRPMLLPQFTAAAVATGVVCLLAGSWTDLATVGRAGLGWTLLTGSVGTILPFWAFLAVIERAETARAALIGYVVPVLAAVGAVLFLGDPLSLSLVTGGTIILAGVVLADRGRTVMAVLSRRDGVRGGKSASVLSDPE